MRREYKNYITWKSAQQASELLVNVIGDDRPYAKRVEKSYYMEIALQHFGLLVNVIKDDSEVIIRLQFWLAIVNGLNDGWTLPTLFGIAHHHKLLPRFLIWA